jgi:hypothetical protein
MPIWPWNYDFPVETLELDRLHGKPAARPRVSAHKPRVDVLIRQAEKTGKVVTSITTPDGFTLKFDEPEQTHGGSAEATGDGTVPLTPEELRKLI